jgi:Ras-related protein Rab-32
MDRNEAPQYKMLVVGDYASGKSSLIKRYTTGLFSTNYKVTIGVDFASKPLTIQHPTSGTPVNLVLSIHDISGHERYGAMLPLYYRHAAAALLVCDVSRKQTLKSIPKWAADMDEKVRLPTGAPLPKVLAINKADLLETLSDSSQSAGGAFVSETEIDAVCKQAGIDRWFYVSAKTNQNVNEAFEALVQRLIEMPETTLQQMQHKERSVNLDQKAGAASNKGGAAGGAGSAEPKKKGCC